MMTLEQIQHALADRRPSIIAKACDLHINTVCSIRDGAKNPEYETLFKLSNYLESRACSYDRTKTN